MSAKRGLRQFGQRGADTLMKELQQLIDQRVMRPRDARTLSQGGGGGGEEKHSEVPHVFERKTLRKGERVGMRRWEKATTLQVEGGDELPNRSIRVIVPVKHDRCKRESEGEDM